MRKTAGEMAGQSGKHSESEPIFASQCWRLKGDGLSAELAMELSRGPDVLLRNSRSTVLDGGGERVVRRVNVVGEEFVFKTYTETKLLEKMRRLWSSSRAKRVYADSRRLYDAQVLTPQPIAYYEGLPSHFSNPTSTFVYRFVPGTTLTQLIRSELSESRRDRLLQQGIELFRSLGRIRVTLSDPAVNNFIVDQNDRLWVIDLDKLRHAGRSESRFRNELWNSFRWFLAEFHWSEQQFGSLEDVLGRRYFSGRPRSRPERSHQPHLSSTQPG